MRKGWERGKSVPIIKIEGKSYIVIGEHYVLLGVAGGYQRSQPAQRTRREAGEKNIRGELGFAQGAGHVWQAKHLSFYPGESFESREARTTTPATGKSNQPTNRTKEYYCFCFG